MQSYCQWSPERDQAVGPVTFPHFIWKIVNYRQKLKKKKKKKSMYHEYPWIHDRGSRMNLWLYLLYHVSVHASSRVITPSLILMHFRVNCGYQSTSRLQHFSERIVPWSSVWFFLCVVHFTHNEIHESLVHLSVSFDKCIPCVTQTPVQGITEYSFCLRKFPPAP